MRTTVTLQPDVEARIRALAAERGTSFTEALNATLRAGLGLVSGPVKPFTVTPFPMSVRPGVDLDKALSLSAALEDDESVRKLEARK